MMIPSRAAAVAVVLAFGLGTSALAQQAPATPAAPAPATPAAPPPAAATPEAAPAAPEAAPPVVAAPLAPVPALPQPEVPPEKLAVAREVVLASGMARSFAPMVPELEAQIPRVVNRTRPELAKDVQAIVVQLQPEFDKKGAEMVDIAARIYARRMSADELKSTAAFFESAAGRRYVEAQPLMLDELVVAMQSWTQEVSTYMMKRVQSELEKKGEKF